jgi:two-component SAPR family response regulator
MEFAPIVSLVRKGNFMIHQRVTRVSLESFQERSAGKKVVLLYPWVNYRNLFLSYFLSSAKDGLLYYRIPQDKPVLQDWMNDLADELEQVLGGFGKLRDALAGGNPGAMGEALAASLGAFRKDRVILFVDELDHAPFDEPFEQFITALVAALPGHVQLAFSSRLLSRQPWYDMVEQGTAVVLGTEFQKNDVIFTLEEEVKPQLEIYGFGRGHALANGREITDWDGALPRNLFFYFADNPLVTRDDIFSTFWGRLTIKEATNVFHVTKRKISERITLKLGEDAENHELTQYSSGFYMPSHKLVRHYDVSNFQEAAEKAMISPDQRETERLYQRAVDLYKAPFMETVKMSWVVERRRHLQLLHANSLIGLGRILKERGANEESFGLFTRALKETPDREDVHREVMDIYIQMELFDDARNQYAHLKKVLDKSFGIAPSRETQEMFQAIPS